MPNVTCDPADRGIDPATGQPYTYWDAAQSFGANGILSYRYGWDGTSQRDSDLGCVGPIIRAQVINGNPETWYAHFKGRKGTWLRLTLDPGVNRTYNTNQLRQAGFDDTTDLLDLHISLSPTPAASW